MTDPVRAAAAAGDRGPALSVVLVSDEYATIARVVGSFREQTVRERIEIVIVTPSPEPLDRAELDGFAAMRVVPVDSIAPLTTARAMGVRAAAGPIVFLGETHSYPHPRFAETLIRAHDGPWAAVVPGFRNANPASALSRAGFLADYGRWQEGLPAGELEMIPTYNSTYKRESLIGLEPSLGTILSSGDSLIIALRAAGGRFYFEPAARIDHVNVAPARPWLVERYLGGLMAAGSRAEGWPVSRRVLYVLASPLIPSVLLWRLRPAVALARRSGQFSASIFAGLVLAMLARAAGELVGYARGVSGRAERRMAEYELHKVEYAGSTMSASRP